MVAGLVWQVVSMSLFLALWADFAFRVHVARKQGVFNTMQRDGFAALRNSRKFRLLQVGEQLLRFLHGSYWLKTPRLNQLCVEGYS